MSNVPTIFIEDILSKGLTLLRCKCNGQSTQVQATKECISTFHSNDRKNGLYFGLSKLSGRKTEFSALSFGM